MTNSPPISRLSAGLARHRRWVVVAMLLALHAGLVAVPGGDFQRVWLLVHFGLFLLWQPFIAADRELDLVGGALVFVITIVTISFLAGWMIVGWLLLLLGILGGRVFTTQATSRNRFYLVAFSYVLAILVLRAVPALLLQGVDFPQGIEPFARYVLPLLLGVLAVIPFGEPRADAGQVFDFFYAVLVFQLGLVVVMGSVALMRFTNDHYFAAVALTMLGFGAALFVLAVLWNPLRGFGGLRTYFSRYLLSVGMPFELWMRRIAELAETESEPRRFLEAALQEVGEFPWVRGARWRSPDGEGAVGSESPNATRFAIHELELVFHTEIRLSPALFLHARLLAQVVGEFYEGKRRESMLRQAAYLQAVHETGARLTHDVKNLLQSLYALTSMAPQEPEEGYMGLLQRQLPQLTRRLNTTLEKLRSPGVATTEMPVPADEWWRDVERRLAGAGLALEAEITEAATVPVALLDGFVENTVDNAIAKRSREPGISVAVRFSVREGMLGLSVCDSGSPIAPDVEARLFREPLERAGGLGIGLFHIDRLARQAGYRVALASNRPGAVCFTLESEAASARQG